MNLTNSSKLIFRPYFIQKGRGPHLLEWAYASDENGDAFHSDIISGSEGVTISETAGVQKFAINVRWNIEGFGYLFITADNGGEFYELPEQSDKIVLNLNYELAKSRVIRNRNRSEKFSGNGWRPSLEVKTYLDLSEELIQQAEKCQQDGEKCAKLSQKALFYTMWVSEMMEVEKARYDISKSGWRKEFFFGCDVRHYHQMPKSVFWESFLELFNFAQLTYVVNGDDQMQYFEPQEGQLQFGLRDFLFHELQNRNIKVGGRTLFWFHKWVTPDWLKNKSYDELKKYVENHTRQVVSHYGNGMYAWEIFNEFHDWANEIQVTPEQTVELTKLACAVAKSEAPDVHRLINNCCPFAEYVQLGEWSGQPAKYPQRTPWQFTRDLVDAGVDFTLIGQQMYFPYRDLQDSIMFLERYESFNIPVQISEVGAPGGPTRESVLTEKYKFSEEPYVWHRPWDEELQADWLEGIYTLCYSKPWIEALNWFDLTDPHAYLTNGGILRSPKGGKKAAFTRLRNLQDRWRHLKT